MLITSFVIKTSQFFGAVFTYPRFELMGFWILFFGKLVFSFWFFFFNTFCFVLSVTKTWNILVYEKIHVCIWKYVYLNVLISLFGYLHSAQNVFIIPVQNLLSFGVNFIPSLQRQNNFLFSLYNSLFKLKANFTHVRSRFDISFNALRFQFLSVAIFLRSRIIVETFSISLIFSMFCILKGFVLLDR